MNFLEKSFQKLKESGYGNILYALLIEGMFLLLLAFAGLFTLEMILPGIIASRFVLAKFLIVIIFLLISTGFFGKFLGLRFPISLSIPKPIRILAFLWAFFLLTLSLLKFPLWSIPIILLAFFGIGYFFRETLLENK